MKIRIGCNVEQMEIELPNGDTYRLSVDAYDLIIGADRDIEATRVAKKTLRMHLKRETPHGPRTVSNR